jgi:molybdopterin molybdotransferase
MMTRRMLTVEEAQATIAAAARPLGSEELAIEEAHRRILSEPISAAFDLPPFTNSAMDGFAVRATDTPATLRIVGESAAGRPFAGEVLEGQAVRISTGAALPAGADAVAIVERVSVNGDALTVPDAVSLDQNVRHAGSDTASGAVIIEAGTRFGSAQIGAAAAFGIARVRVGVRPTVAIIPTGSELTAPGQPLPPGGIYDSNGPMLRALVSEAGGTPTMILPPRDTSDAVRHALAQAFNHDLVITTGGVSVGPHDVVREVAAELGVTEHFWGVKLRPGKPLSFGHHARSLVFGIPGNPVSTLVCFELFVRPVLEAMQGVSDAHPRFEPRILAEDVQPNRERDEMVRVLIGGDGCLTPLRGQMSHQLATSAKATGLAWIPLGDTALAAGSTVRYLALRG